MDKEEQGLNVAKALRKLAQAIEEGTAIGAVARTQLELAEVVMPGPMGLTSYGVTPTGNVTMTVTFHPVKR